MYVHRLQQLVQSIWLRMMLGIGMACGVSIIFFMSLQVQRVSDTVTPLLPITREQASQYGPYVTLVHAGLFITNVTEFTVEQNHFYFDGIVWFEYDPRKVSLDTLGKFSFVDATIRVKSDPDVKLVDENRALATWRVTVRMVTKLRFDYYPYEGHRLGIVLTNNTVSPGEIMFTTSRDAFAFASDVIQSDWRVKPGTLAAESGYARAYLDAAHHERRVSCPQVKFSFACVGTGTKGIIIIFLPLLFALLLGLFALLIPYRYKGDNGLSWGLAITTATSVLGYRFVLQSMMPSVGYMTTADWFYTLVLVATFVPFLYQILLAIFMRKELASDTRGYIREERLNTVNLGMFVLVSCVVIVSLIKILL